LEDAAATVGGEVKSINRKLIDFQQKVNDLDRAIDAFLVEGNEAGAVAAQSKLNSTQRLLETYQEQLTRQQGEYEKLLGAKVKLEARLVTMRQQREELQALLELAKSKETTVKAIKSLDDLAGTGDADIARVAESIRSRLDKATAASELQATNLDKQMDDVLDRGVLNAQLLERKQKLGLTN
jgi:phage shock protein A